jgi:O-acetyl-ADP-ribose deacetylase (regulator of RNase III)
MIETQTGNLLTAPAEALVNTVNTEGVMGKGIALQFRQAFPEMFRAYEAACKRGEVRLGHMHVHDLGGLVGGPRWIINFPTKGHWRSKSRLADIEAGLKDLAATIIRLGIHSIAVPPLGCGNGGLAWSMVRPKIADAFAPLTAVKVLLYAPEGAPVAADMPNKTKKPQMTLGQATLVSLMDRYLRGMLDPFVSLLEVHKLMYFLKAAGEPLPRLHFTKGAYGPYSKDIRHGLIRMENHLTRGYGQGSDDPLTPIELLPGAVEAATAFLAGAGETRGRMEQVAGLIAGFEDSYGMELLSSVHWVMANNAEAAVSPQTAIAAVWDWNERKRKTLKAEHLQTAWRRIKDHGWA